MEIELADRILVAILLPFAVAFMPIAYLLDCVGLWYCHESDDSIKRYLLVVLPD